MRALLESVGAQADQGGARGEGGEWSLLREGWEGGSAFPGKEGGFVGLGLGVWGKILV